jgi:hypothetical protein
VAHFQVYLSGQHQSDELAQRGLSGLVDGAFRAECMTGPDGKRGSLFGWMTTKGKLDNAYRPERQKWTPAVPMDGMEAGRYWVGYDPENPPTPDDLQRRYPYRGVRSQLGDGNEWWLAKETEIPATMRLADNGEWKFIPQRQFDEFCQATANWRSIMAGVNPHYMVAEIVEFVRLALGINYRLTPEIESELGLWTDKTSGTVLQSFLLLLLRPEVFVGE